MIVELNDNKSATYQNSGDITKIVIWRKGLNSYIRIEERLTVMSEASNLKSFF